LKGEKIMKRIAIIAAAIGVLLVTSAAAEMADIPYHGEGYTMLNESELEWGDVASMAPGDQMAIIEGDLSREAPFTFRLRLPADYSLPPHTHPAYERVTVLSGILHFAHGEEFDRTKTQALEAGGVAIMPPGAPMFGYTEEETIIQLHGTGPWGIKYVNPEDDPRK
jgi:hypothetical protein